MSPPAQKGTRPSSRAAPRMTTAAIAGSSAHSLSLASSPSTMGWVSAFSAFGRFSVTLPTRPFRSRMISSLTAAPFRSMAGASYSPGLWSARHFAPGMIHVIPGPAAARLNCGRSERKPLSGPRFRATDAAEKEA